MNQVCHYLNDALMFRIHDNRLQGGFTDQINRRVIGQLHFKHAFQFSQQVNYSLLHGGKQAFPAGETSVPIKGNASFHEGKLPFPAAETELNIGGVRLKKGLHHLPKRV